MNTPTLVPKNGNTKMIRWIRILVVVVVSALVVDRTKANVDGNPVCAAQREAQRRDSEFIDAFLAVVMTHPADVTIRTPTLIPVRDYTKPLRPSSEYQPYQKMKEECEEGLGYSLCEVSSDVVYENVADGRHRVIARELKRPVCLPDTCRDEDAVNILYPDPLYCRGPDCRMVRTEVSCPSGRGYYPNLPQNCTDDAAFVQSSAELNKQLDVLETRMENECVKRLHGETSEWCQLNTVPTNADASSMNHNVVRDYSKLPDSPKARRMEKECHDLGFSMCMVDTEAQVGQIRLYEIGKPLCISSSCRIHDDDNNDDESSDWALLDPYPICKTDDCTIVSRKVTCPSPGDGSSIFTGNATTNDTTCAQNVEVLSIAADVQAGYKNMEKRVDADCIGYLHGQGETDALACAVERESTMEVAFDMKDLKDTAEYDDFYGVCESDGGRVCWATATTLYEMRNRREYLNGMTLFHRYPVCVPDVCWSTEEDRRDTVTSALFAGYGCSDSSSSTAISRRSVSDGSQCQTIEMDYVCDPVPPSAAPSKKQSDGPTAVRSVVPSDHPSSTQSDLPSIYSTRTSSSFPSASPSFRTSATPTEFISTQPSSSPMSPPTSVPSDSPTSIPSNPPTILKSEFPSIHVPPSSSPLVLASTTPSTSRAPNDLRSSLPTFFIDDTLWVPDWLIEEEKSVSLSLPTGGVRSTAVTVSLVVAAVLLG